MRLSARGARLIEGFEGFSSRPYRDSVGVLTIGYGTTGADIRPLPSFLSPVQADALLRHRVDTKYGAAVNGLGARLNQNQFDALCSFAYNLGPGSMSWDVGTYCRVGKFHAAATAMLQYDHAGGVRLAGLTRRRQEEVALFLSPVKRPAFNPHYELFATSMFTLGNRRVQEQHTVKLFDRLNQHPFRNGLKLHGVRRDLAFLRDRIRYVAEHADRQNGWTHGRKWRYEELLDRAPRGVKASTS